MKKLKFENIFGLTAMLLGLLCLFSTIIIYFNKPFVWESTESYHMYENFKNNPQVYYILTLTIILFFISYLLNRKNKVKLYTNITLFGAVILILFISFITYRLKTLTWDEKGSIVFPRPK